MKRVRKNGRRWASKIFSIWVILLLLFQPIGTPGMLAIAEELSPAPTVEKEASKEASKEDPKSEEKVEVEKEAPKAEVVAPVEKTDPVPAPKEEPKGDPVVPVEKPAEKTEPAAAGSISDPIVEAEPAGEITPEAASTEKVDGASITASEMPKVETPVEDAPDLTQEVKKETWSVDGKKATTNEPVELEKEYKFPGDEDVSVRFTKLPEKPGTLSIEEIGLSDKQVEELGALSKIAYDITSTMEDGSFEYDLSLPKSKDDKNVQVKFAEKISELDDARIISADDVTEKNDSVNVEKLDHFTVFVVVEWNFPNNPDNSIADDGIASNLARNMTVVGATNLLFSSSGATSNSASADHWNGGSGIKYWQVEFDSSGYNSIRLYSKQRSSNTGPRDFKIQYSTDSGSDWADISGGNIVVANNYTAGVIAELHLPTQCNNRASVYLRWIMTSDTSVSGGAVGNTGVSNIDDIIVKGEEIEIVPDADGDDVPDSQDNCINTPNGPKQINDNQLDDDGDGLGNACDILNCIATGEESCNDLVDNDCDGEINEDCVISFCGNGTVDFGEDCDINSQKQACLTDGGYPGEITCGESCSWNNYCYPIAGCGDGIMNGPEQCDDGNEISGDGCENDCTVTPQAEFCGDGIVNGDEKCDDGNVVSGDGCSASCEVEKTGSISGKKFEDCSANGIFDRCEQGMRGWAIFIDKNNDGILDPEENVALTGKGGYYIFTNLYPGTYRICEASKAGWIQTAPGEDGCHEVVLNGERLTGYDFGNFKLGTVSGRKFNDLNGNGWKNFNEPYLNDWTIRLYDSTWQKVAETATAGSGWEKGQYSFDSLERGTNYICEAMSEGWEQTSPKNGWSVVNNLSGMEDEGAKCWKVEDTCSGNVFAGKSFGNHFTPPAPTGKISGVKFEDTNGNQLKEESEAKLSGWTIYLDANNNSQKDPGELNTITDANGYYEFVGLTLRNYYVREENQAGWIQTTPYHNNGAYYVSLNKCHLEAGGMDFGNRRQPLVYCGDGIVEPYLEQCDDGNAISGDGCSADCMLETGSIHGYKWNDLDGNGTKNGEEGNLSGWMINLYRSNGDGYDSEPIETMMTDSSEQHFGWYWFQNLLPGKYKVCEVLQSGWAPIYPTTDKDDNCHLVTLPDDNSFNFRESENAVTGPEYNFGNQPTSDKPTLRIEKSNDASAPQAPGSDVTYTIKVTALANPVLKVQVTDLPPAGFIYRAGSATGAPFIHEYASPGVWDLGDMAAGETKTLTYVADIDNDQDSGTYKDIAWAKGTASSGATVFALGNQEASPFFVGTDVEVIDPVTADVALAERTETKTKHKTETKHRTVIGEVLGASTMLPETGADTTWVVVALLALLSGLGLIVLGRRKNNLVKVVEKTMKIFILVFVFGSLAISGGNALADSGNISVQIEQPKSPSTNNFLLGFVALDIEGRAMTVECYKNSDTAPFQTINFSNAGGNSGNCIIDENIASTDGNYSFHVKASAGSDTVSSSEVVVEIATDAPGTPTNFSHTKSGCAHNISLMTADDSGKTVRVEIYRSTEPEFVADETTRIFGVDASSNQAVSFSDNAPDCNETYYYVARAFNLADEGSGFVGDENVIVKKKTDTNHKTKTKTIHPTSLNVTTTGVGQSAGAGANSGAVAGNEVTGGEQQGQVSGTENNQEIAGAQTENAGDTGSLAKNGNFWLLLAVAAGAGLWYYKKKKQPVAEIK
ncbi:MAG: SdrD B-like domain-containing protein [Parcubacteria group bacterium]|jgi:LPXTG-motif cell wall-anchored protein/uncharacterized repeat protein (TIGR01451 family)